MCLETPGQPGRQELSSVRVINWMEASRLEQHEHRAVRTEEDKCQVLALSCAWSSCYSMI